MALVMLPCDLPWWTTVTKRLTAIEESTNLEEILDNMLKIHDLCNVSLDPDEDNKDKTIFEGLQLFVETILEVEERAHFLNVTVKNLAKHAKQLKQFRPARGLSFSLQQQKDTLDLEVGLIAALLANAFFSTFPKRTIKTHPTLQDFNFTHFFTSLDLNVQIAKLKSFFQYFEWLETDGAQTGSVRISRKVMTGKQWLTIEDWLECSLPLCPLEIKHEGRMDQSDPAAFQTVFTHSRLGGDVLYHGSSQECIYFSTFPEMLAILLYVEALEDNEALIVEHLHQVTRVRDVKDKAQLEVLVPPKQTSLCCIDAENYRSCPPSQFEEDNVLRELNKCLLAYRQNTTGPMLEARDRKSKENVNRLSRLSPIGENNASIEAVATIVIKQASTATMKSSCDSSRMDKDINKRRSWLAPPDLTIPAGNQNGDGLVSGPLASGRRGRFIVLGSSGECLPVNRSSVLSQGGSSSLYSSCNSSVDEFHSATASAEDSEDEGFSKRYSKELDTPERRNTFAQKLKDALKSESGYTDSTDDSYACGINVVGSRTDDQEIKVRRGGSRGFILTEDSLDEEFYRELLHCDEQARTNNRAGRNRNAVAKLIEAQDSSKYSFSTEFSSELEEVFDQISKWLDNPIDDKNRVLDTRDQAVLQFANSLLKRTLSETFVGVPLSDDGFYSLSSGSTGDTMPPKMDNECGAGGTSTSAASHKRNKFIINARSLSLELAKHNHKLAAQLDIDVNNNCTINGQLPPPVPPRRRKNKSTPKSSIKWSISNVQCEENVFVTVKLAHLAKKHVSNDNKSNLQPVATGNWGCGSTNRGDVQLKLVIQWMAASVAGVPALIYYTAGNENLSKLDTVRRILLDRKTVVGQLALTTLTHAREILDDPGSYVCRQLFDKLIGIESI